MEIQQQEMVIRFQAEEETPQQGALGQIESAACFVPATPFRLTQGGRARHVAEVNQRQGDGHGRQHVGPASSPRIAEDGSQGLVTIHDVLDRPCHGFDVERSAQPHGPRSGLGSAPALDVREEPKTFLHGTGQDFLAGAMDRTGDGRGHSN